MERGSGRAQVSRGSQSFGSGYEKKNTCSRNSECRDIIHVELACCCPIRQLPGSICYESSSPIRKLLPKANQKLKRESSIHSSIKHSRGLTSLGRMGHIEIEEVNSCEALPLLSLNHVSLLCRSVWDSMRFYEEVLGFVLIKRPSSFNFNGAWLYNYGFGIHLIESPAMEDSEPRPINPKDNHISFQCTDVGLVKRNLQEMGMRYVTAVVEDDGIKVDQVFFHDPDGYMVELCNCENIPIIPVSSVSSCAFKPRSGSFSKAPTSCGFMETLMMESLSLDMMNFSF